MQTFSTRRASKATIEKQQKNALNKLKEKGAKNTAKAAKRKTPPKQYSLDDLSPELRAALEKFKPIEEPTIEPDLEFDADDKVDVPWEVNPN